MPRTQNAHARGLVNVKSGRHGGLKESACRSAQSGILRMAEHRSQGPQGAAMAVFRANVFQPFAVIAEKISEPSGIGMKCEPEKSQIAAREVELMLAVLDAPARSSRSVETMSARALSSVV